MKYLKSRNFIAFIGVVCVILFVWAFAFWRLTGGEEWKSIEVAIRSNIEIQKQFPAGVSAIKPSIWGYRYRFNGDKVVTQFDATVVAGSEIASVRFQVERHSLDSQWSVRWQRR
jgi:hypothetical protein